MQTYLCTFICINTYLLGYLHDTTASTMSVVPTMRRRKATLGQLRQQISCYLQHSTYYICTYICMYIHTYDNDKDAVIYLVAVKTPTNLYKNKLHATLCPLKASKKLWQNLSQWQLRQLWRQRWRQLCEAYIRRGALQVLITTWGVSTETYKEKARKKGYHKKVKIN